MWILGTELKSPCLCGKHLPQWAISPAFTVYCWKYDFIGEQPLSFIYILSMVIWRPRVTNHKIPFTVLLFTESLLISDALYILLCSSKCPAQCFAHNSYKSVLINAAWTFLWDHWNYNSGKIKAYFGHCYYTTLYYVAGIRIRSLYVCLI